MRICRFFVFAGVLVFACGAARADGINVYFSPATSNQAVGSSFTIDVLADVPQNPGLVDFGFNLLWDSSMMQLNDVSGTGSPWDILWDSSAPESITGLLFPTETSPASESGSRILLAALEFECLQEGSSALNGALDPDLLGAGLQGFYGPSGELIDASFTQGNVDQSLSVVPEPGTIFLVTAGLASLAYRKRRRA